MDDIEDEIDELAKKPSTDDMLRIKRLQLRLKKHNNCLGPLRSPDHNVDTGKDV